MTVMSMPALPDCAACGGPVSLVIDGDGTAVEECAGCGIAQAPQPPKLDRAAIRAVVRQARKRRLLAPKCFGRLHHQCKTAACECLCHSRKGDG